MSRLLVRLPRWVGDTVMALPTLKALGRRHGKALSLWGPPSAQALARNAAPAATLIDEGSEPRILAAHDAALLLDGSLRSAWRVRLAGIGCVLTPGEGGRRFLFPLAVQSSRLLRRRRRSPRPFSAVVQELAALLPRPFAVAVDDPSPRLDLPDSLRQSVQSRLARVLPPDRPAFVLVNAGGRPGSAKALPIPWLHALLEGLIAAGIAPLLVAGPGEEDRVSAALVPLAYALGGPALDPLELAAAGSLAAACLTPDGGGRHLLRAGGARCVSVFGPTDPRHSATNGPAEIRLSRRVPCGPCHRETCTEVGPDLLRCFVPPNQACQALRTMLDGS